MALTVSLLQSGRTSRVISFPWFFHSTAHETEFAVVVASIGVVLTFAADDFVLRVVAVVALDLAFEGADELDRLHGPVGARGAGEGQGDGVAVRHRRDRGVRAVVGRQVVEASEGVFVTASSFVFESRNITS